MTLRAKALLAISLTLVGLLLVLYASLSSILLGNVDQLEKQSVQQNVKRVLEALSDTLAKLDSTTRDYAWRNDTYAFIEDHNSAFIKSNLGNETMANLGISLEVYVDSSGHVVVSKGFDLEKNKEVPIPASLKTHLVLSDSLLKHADTTSSLTGIVFLSEGPLLVASRPILMSEGKGPIRGTLLMGRFLSKAEFSRLSQITELSLTAHRWDEAQMTADLKAVRDSLSTNGSVVTRPLSAESIAGYTVLKDIYGKPALLLEVDSARPIYAQGQLSLLYLIVSLIVVGLVFGVLVLLLLERLMFSRLARLSTEVARVGAGGNLSARLAVAGKDELVSLASTINEMLQSLESSEQEHHKGEERLRLSDEILQRVSALVLVADSQGQIIYASPSVKTILDYAPNDLLGDGWWQISRDDPAQREQEKDYVARAARGEVSPPPTTYERMVKRRDGTSRWILWQDTRGPGDFLVGVGNDITARKQAEQALQEDERKLRLITENIGDVVFLYDMNRRLQYVNPAFETLTGYTIEELYEQNFINFIHPDDNVRMLSLWEALFQGKSVSGEEFRIATKKGQTKWVWSSASPVFDAEGRQIGIQVKDQDITWRKQAEEALRKAEEQYHSIFDNVPLGLYRTTYDGQFLAANPTLLEMLGYPDLESLQKVNVLELYVHPEDRPRGQAQMEQANVPHVFEMPLRRRDGRIIWVRDNARVTYDTHGHLLYYEGALEDITETKRIVEELRKSEERLRQLFENANDGIYIRDSDGTIKFANRRFAEMNGLPPEQVVGRKITDLFLLTPEERERISQHVQEALVRGEPPAMLEVRLLRPDGSIGYVQGNLAFIKERGQVQEMFGIVRDITERKQLETQLKESEERYRDLIENATDMIITIDLQGNFVYGNKKAIEFLGYSYEEAVENLTRKPFWSILVEEDLPKAAEY
ncbi:PAS domain S-box protein, partial [Candidatus Acetothermia bacterium]|nr:PAS domain S-box protein [Candidatus Acetothermia bacterium]